MTMVNSGLKGLIENLLFLDIANVWIGATANDIDIVVSTFNLNLFNLIKHIFTG